MTVRHLLNVLALMLCIFVCFSAQAQAPAVSSSTAQLPLPQTPPADFVVGMYHPEAHDSLEIDEINQREYALSMLRAAAKAVNLTFDVFTHIPENDVVAGLHSGKMQLIGPVPVVEGRLKDMEMTTPILIAKGAAFPKPLVPLGNQAIRAQAGTRRLPWPAGIFAGAVPQEHHAGRGHRCAGV